MNDFQKKFILKRQDYGILYPYLIDDEVTDINWNGRQLWIDHLRQGRYMSSEILPEEFVERLVSLIANVTNQVINRLHPVLEAETEELRISVVHQSVAHSGTTISLRKTPAVQRLNKSLLLDSGYCIEEVHSFLKNCVKAHFSIAICGLPGAGKTELLKYLTKFIPATERVITIEEVLEIHYQQINPNKDCVEMKIAENFSYMEAIKACIRQLPKWIILSEARSTEVKYLLETLSTGANGLTTIHTDDVRNIPERIKSMASEKEDLCRIENDTYRYLDIGILVKNGMKHKDGKHRRIEQICIFERYGLEWKEMKNRIVMIVEDGKIVEKKLPEGIVNRFRDLGINDPFLEVQDEKVCDKNFLAYHI